MQLNKPKNKLRATLTQYTKQELQADENKCQELANALSNGIKPYLPQYYVEDASGKYAIRPYKELIEYHCQLRWRIGSQYLRNKLAATDTGIESEASRSYV